MREKVARHGAASTFYQQLGDKKDGKCTSETHSVVSKNMLNK